MKNTALVSGSLVKILKNESKLILRQLIKIKRSENIQRICPDFVGAALFMNIKNTVFCAELWDVLENTLAQYRSKYTTESIKEITSIQATRNAYKKLGKDPSRYRPSGEALIRRILKGNKLYKVNTAVDIINLASILYGYSIGGFDCDKIRGNELILGVGDKNEPYEGIGRGVLNIENMPVYRDAIAGIGTPTSDNERTKLDTNTIRILVIVNGYDNNQTQVEACTQFISQYLELYTSGTNKQIILF